MIDPGRVRRHAAALRLPALDCGHHDPLDCHHDGPDVPGTLGLTPAELRAEANRLALGCGWQIWEVLARLDVQPTGCRCCPVHGKETA